MLESIYPSEYTFTRFPDHATVESHRNLYSAKFSMTVKPATAGDISQQNISVILELFLPFGYPDSPPGIRFKQPRGVSDFQLLGLRRHLEEEVEKKRGEAIIYDLIDILTQNLTQSNFPSVECPFCLCAIEDGDEFFRSECFHYSHAYCMRKYVDHMRRRGSENGEKFVKVL